MTLKEVVGLDGECAAEWLGISESDMNGSINRYKEKMEQIGIHFDSIPDMTEAFLEVWTTSKTTKRSFHELKRKK